MKKAVEEIVRSAITDISIFAIRKTHPVPKSIMSDEWLLDAVSKEIPDDLPLYEAMMHFYKSDIIDLDEEDPVSDLSFSERWEREKVKCVSTDPIYLLVLEIAEKVHKKICDQWWQVVPIGGNIGSFFTEKDYHKCLRAVSINSGGYDREYQIFTTLVVFKLFNDYWQVEIDDVSYSGISFGKMATKVSPREVIDIVYDPIE